MKSIMSLVLMVFAEMCDNNWQKEGLSFHLLSQMIPEILAT